MIDLREYGIEMWEADKIASFREKLLTWYDENKRDTCGVGFGCSSTARIVDKTVDSLLQHTFFVAEYHLGSFYLYQSFQTVVSDDDTAIEVVEV